MSSVLKMCALSSMAASAMAGDYDFNFGDFVSGFGGYNRYRRCHNHRRIRINGLTCDNGIAAAMCSAEYCNDGGDIVKAWRGGADEYQTCQLCWEEACNNGHSEFCDLGTTCTRPKPKKTDKIAIVGAGVHGLFMARALKRAGYQHVTVFEKEAEAAGSTHTTTVDGHVHDWSTKILGADDFMTPGFLPELQSMIDEYGLTTRPFLTGQFYDADLGGAVLPLPHVLLPFTATPELQQQLVSEMIWGFEFLKAVQVSATTPEEILQTGIVFKNETFTDFAARINKPAFTAYMEFLSNGFLNGPIADMPVAVVLNCRTSYQAAYLKQLLLGFGITADSPLPLSDELRGILGAEFKGAGWVINEGMQTLFNRIIEREGLDVCLGCEVRSVRYTWSGKIKVKVSDEPRRTFDHLILSSRPHDTIKFLRQETAQRELLTAASATDPVNIFMFRVESTPAQLGTEFAAFTYPGAHHWAADGSITGAVREFADSNVMIAIGYADPDMTGEEAVEKATADMAYAQMPVTELVGHRQFNYVSIPPVSEVENDWFAKTTFEQGARNTYMIGEVFSGYGVLPGLRFVNNFKGKYFE
eukprot:TRINITY_DN27_c0_g1_i11.p1 TRINITY_DN27_c0_g1~~TRINITY_DN27_c0_g1_i11.p1  ORF type:complete len:601 (+),score=151.06 TRINITY_DN27_c0_g1_i11:50-1804(+)